MNCFICHAPFHPTTGGLFGHQQTPFCGPCVRSCITMVKEWQGRRLGAHAFQIPLWKNIQVVSWLCRNMESKSHLLAWILKAIY